MCIEMCVDIALKLFWECDVFVDLTLGYVKEQCK